MKKILNFIETVLILGFIFFEELIWYRFALPIYKKLQQLRLFSRFDAYLADDASPLNVLLIFLLPFFIMEFMAISAGHFFISGQFVWGSIFYIHHLITLRYDHFPSSSHL
jgi:riboflavin transporter FmnP